MFQTATQFRGIYDSTTRLTTIYGTIANKTYYNKAKLLQFVSLLYILMHLKATALQKTIRESLSSKGDHEQNTFFETRNIAKNWHQGNIMDLVMVWDQGNIMWI